MHRRLHPREHGFVARLFYFGLDLDELPEVTRRIPWIARNRFHLYSFHDRDHLFLGNDGVRENLLAYLAREGLPGPFGRIHLVTQLRVLGYVFNPVSFFFLYDPAGNPAGTVAEVHNTFGELKPFLLRPESHQGSEYRDQQAKFFYISPFSDLDTDLIFQVALPDEKLAIRISGTRPEGVFFRSSLTGRRVALTNRNLLRATARYPLVTLQIILRIHWQALRIYWKKVPFRRKQDQPDLQRGILPKAPPGTRVRPAA